jgi:hypothetical protein
MVQKELNSQESRICSSQPTLAQHLKALGLDNTAAQSTVIVPQQTTPDAKELALARTGIQLCQVQYETGWDSSVPKSQEQIIEALQEIVKATGNLGKHKIRKLYKLSNQTILIEWFAQESAEWNTTPEINEKFEEAIGPLAKLKVRTYAVLGQFIPLYTFDPADEEHLQDVEETNGYEDGAIVRAKYIKKPQRRKPGQTTAHVIFEFRKPETANEAINRGMKICNKHISARKLQKDPVRCLRCQKYNHIRAECDEKTETCANCAESHSTNSCPNPSKLKCSNCKGEHGAWARECLEFARRKEKFDERHAENKYPFYFSRETWTQAAAPPRVSSENKYPDHLAAKSLDRHNQPTPSGKVLTQTQLSNVALGKRKQSKTESLTAELNTRLNPSDWNEGLDDDEEAAIRDERERAAPLKQKERSSSGRRGRSSLSRPGTPLPPNQTQLPIEQWTTSQRSNPQTPASQ